MAEINSDGKNLSVISASPPGSLYTTVHTERKVKLYAVVEPELEQLSSLNSGSVLFFSFGSGFMGLAADGLLSILSTEAPAGVVAYSAAFGFISLTCFIIGGLLLKKRASILRTIKSQASERG